ncbi:MAG: M48 family metalloprotease [Pseudomonadota bacterium]
MKTKHYYSSEIKYFFIFTFLSLYPLGVFASAYSNLPDIGSSSARILSIKEEQELGDKIMYQVRRSLPLIDDPEINAYVQHLGFKLVAQNADAMNRQFYFFVVDDPSINAFALPGGYIGLHTGFIKATENEHELAGVIAHEIAHVTQRHLARRAELNSNLSLPTIASMIGSVLIAMHNSEAGIAALQATQAGRAQALINHTRSNEAEADRIGINMLESAGFDAMGLVTFFEKMQKSTQYYQLLPEFLSTHPLSRTRIADARARVTSSRTPYRATTSSYEFVKAKLDSLLSKNKNQLKKYLVDSQLAFRNSQTPANRFALALAYYENEKYSEAEEILTELYQDSPDNISFIVNKARVNNQLGKEEESIQILNKGLETFPSNHPLTVALAESYLSQGNANKARLILINHIYVHNESISLYRLLAEAQKRSGNIAEAYESQGQLLYLLGDIHGAKAQFQRALRRKNRDPYLDERVNARIDQIDQIIYDLRRARRR